MDEKKIEKQLKEPEALFRSFFFVLFLLFAKIYNLIASTSSMWDGKRLRLNYEFHLFLLVIEIY